MSPAPVPIAVVGATATGKTDLAEALAVELDAEVVCCDSRQVFAELEVGTGKPSPAERAALPHHLFDALRLGQDPSAGWFARAAGGVCDALHARGRRPLLVGGSGLYLKALCEGLAPAPPRDPAVRERLRGELAAEGPETLHLRLAAVDPASAGRLAPRDGQRIVRALEVFEISGRPLSWWHARPTGAAAAGRWHLLELTVPPATLRARIARRSGWMFEHGLVEETRALLAAGRGPELAALRAIGYDEAMALIAGRLDRAGAEARVTLRTAQLAKRQRTWFRHQVEATRLESDGADPAALARAALARLRGAGAAGGAGRGH